MVVLNVCGTSSNKLVAQLKRIAYFDGSMKLMMRMPTVDAVDSNRQEIVSNTVEIFTMLNAGCFRV